MMIDDVDGGDDDDDRRLFSSWLLYPTVPNPIDTASEPTHVPCFDRRMRRLPPDNQTWQWQSHVTGNFWLGKSSMLMVDFPAGHV